MVTVAVNPKEYYESFKCKNVNKKHKGLRKGAPGMDFQGYSKRINSIKENETFGSQPAEKQKHADLQLKAMT